MTCGPEPQRFRILRQSTHWELDLDRTGDVDTIGDVIRLQPTADEIDAIIDRHFLTPFLARGCSPCEWYLAISDPCCPRTGVFQLVRGRWCELRPGGRALELGATQAIAAAGERLAIRADGSIYTLSRGGRRITRSIWVGGDGPIALDARGYVYAGVGDTLLVFGRDGDEVGRRRLPSSVVRLAVDACGTVWIVVATPVKQVWVWKAGELHQLEGDLETQLSALPPTSVSLHDDDAFCVEISHRADAPQRLCFDRCGRPARIDAVPFTQIRSGTAETKLGSPIDSFMPRCRWHRVRLDADVPAGTSIVAEVAAVENDTDTPHADDWQIVRDDATDFLIQQPAGRYLHLRLRLESTTVATPVIRTIRLDLPRSTSAEWLPAIYRDAPGASDFLERFLSIFDATIEDLDRAIERFPALLDTDHTPDHALPWLASLVGATLDASWSVDRRRALLKKIPELYRRRGTPEGLRMAVEALTGLVPALDELNLPSPFGALADRRDGSSAGAARLGQVRLFGRGRARARLGSSILGATELKSYGDPDNDARSALAFRVRVSLPATSSIELSRIERILDANLPAHVIAKARVGEPLAAIGRAAAVGIDTVLRGLPRPILGTNTRLRRSSALWPGASRGDGVIAVGRAAALGIQTILR